tara:strand:- start:202 stop:519 length:318 start_codon:yes stop_codon:yes gene_type:complete
MEKPNQMLVLYHKLLELEKSADEMERSSKRTYELADQVHQYMMNLQDVPRYHSITATKLEFVCNRIDETSERAGDLSALSEELWSDKEEFFQCEEEIPCEGGHTK